MSLSPLQEHLIFKHMDTADKIAFSEWSKAKHALDLEELKSIAYGGLVQASDNYPNYCLRRNYDIDDHEKFFYTYVRLRIKGAIIDFLRANDKWAGRSVRAKSRKLREAGQDNGASLKQMSEQSGLSEQEVFETIHVMSNRPVSLEAEEIDTAVIQSTESSAFVNFLLETLVDVVSNLDDMSQTVLALHYFQECELQNVAKIMGITDHRVTELHTESVIKVRQSLEEATKSGRGGVGSILE